jgi:hypothetical protein
MASLPGVGGYKTREGKKPARPTARFEHPAPVLIAGLRPQKPPVGTQSMSDTTTTTTPADQALLAAEQEIAALRQKARDLSEAGDDADHPEIWNRVFALEGYIAETAPDSLIGAAVKLRRLADPEIGLEAGPALDDAGSVQQILATVGDDTRVLALFDDWLAASRETDGLVDYSDDSGKAEYNAALDRRNETGDEIASIPGGAAALAIKIYLHFKETSLFGSWAPADATLCEWELSGDDDAHGPRDTAVSLLRDAAKLVPELAELAAPIIHEDAFLITADIKIQWCRDRLRDDCLNQKGREEIQQALSQVLDRVAKAEAKTPRGAAIKLRHGEPQS